MTKGLEKLIGNLAAFDTFEVYRAIVIANKDAITEAMRAQMAEGADITGTVRIDGYVPATITRKQRYGIGLGAETDRVTFFMTGDLYESLDTIFEGDYFSIRSDKPTFEYMLERVGVENYGLSELQRVTLAEGLIIPQFREALLLKTGLQI